MSIFGAIQKSANALQVAELGLQVVGNNIANAATPGYIRQELVQSSGPAVRIGGTTISSGVKAIGVKQVVDEFLQERLRQVRSDLESSNKQGSLYGGLESILGEMGDNDLSSRMNDLSTSIQDLLNQPGNDSIRRLVIERGKTVASQIRTVSQQLNGFNTNLNSETQQAVESVNQMTNRLAQLNTRIVELEGGKDSKTSDAVGLRDERLQILNDLSAYVDVHAVEQSSGAVSVFVGGEYLVADGNQRPLTLTLQTDDNGQSYPQVRFVDTDSPLQVAGGSLHGIYTAREQIVNGIGTQLDEFAKTLIQQFNKIHSQGQGSIGMSQVTSSFASDDSQGPLDLAGYEATLNNGGFQIKVHDLESGTAKTYDIRVELSGGTNDSSLEDIRSQIDDIPGLTSSISSTGYLNISADSHNLQFSFQQDTANFLGAVGINTFFAGNSASTIEVNQLIVNDPRLFAASLSGLGNGTQNAIAMAQAFEDPLSSLGGKSLKETYEDMIVRVTQDVSLQKGKSEGLQNFYQTLQAKSLAVTGVNMDEEAVKMLFFQRIYQANSRLIQTSNEMLETLVQL
jgi:flagellar hook-associated protein 1